MPKHRDNRRGRIFRRRLRQKDGSFRVEDAWTLMYDCHLPGQPRQQKSERFETKREAEARWSEVRKELDAAVVDADRGQHVAPKDTTVSQLLQSWFDLGHGERGEWRMNTTTRYRSTVNQIQESEIASIKVQTLRRSHLLNYYRSLPTTSAKVHAHAAVHSALDHAVHEKLLPYNLAVRMKGRPRREHAKPEERNGKLDDARMNCWTRAEMRKFVDHVKAQDTQTAAFYVLALDSGARKGELCGLQWNDLDWETGKLRIERTLVKGGAKPKYEKPKNGKTRTILLDTETLKLLQAHKRAQAELMMRNRGSYQDLGLVFAKCWDMGMGTQKDHLGEPLQWNNLGERWLDPLIAAAKVKRITVHGIRHTTATLLILDKWPVNGVADRLGHSDTEITYRVYAHLFEDNKRELATAMGKMMHG